MTENGTFFQEICRFFALLYDLLSIYNMPFSRPLQSIQKKQKWERQTISCKCQQCHYINGSRADSHRQSEVLISPSYPLYV
jgi:predicted SprT family Zn-dependent metalloprotease